MRVLFCSLLSLWTYRNSHVENGTHKRIKYVGYMFLLQQHDNFPENLAPSSPRMCNMGHVHILWMKKIQTGRNESSPLEKGKCVCVRPVQSFKIKFTKLIYIVPWSKLERASYVCVTMKIVYWLENSLQQYLPSSNVILLSENFKLISIIFKKKHLLRALFTKFEGKAPLIQCHKFNYTMLILTWFVLCFQFIGLLTFTRLMNNWNT